MVNHRLKESIELAASWVYGTGQAIWLPIGQYFSTRHSPEGESSFSRRGARNVPVYGARNSSRMPAFHRLDFSIRFHRSWRKVRRVGSIGLYNAYNRRNPFFLVTETVSYDENEEEYFQFKKISLFPIIPSLSYQLIF